MAELVRKIEAVDLPKIADLLLEVFGNAEYAEIERLGGNDKSFL